MQTETDTQFNAQNLEDGERSKPIFDTTHLLITDRGRVFHLVDGRWCEMAPKDNGLGYLRIWVPRTATRAGQYCYIHRLVMWHFGAPPAPHQTLVRHLDDVKTNNHIENLSWGTTLDNVRDAKRNGCYPTGEANHSAKLKREDVERIKRQPRLHTQTIWAQKLGVSQSNINSILTGRTWSHVTPTDDEGGEQ